MNRPPRWWIALRFAVDANLQSATYKKSARWVSSRSSSQVSRWVRSSAVLPLAVAKQIGTPLSSVTVKVYNNC